MSSNEYFSFDRLIPLEEAEASGVIREIEPGLFTATDEPANDELSPQLQPTSHKELALNGLKSAIEIADLSVRLIKATPKISRQILKSTRYKLGI